MLVAAVKWRALHSHNFLFKYENPIETDEAAMRILHVHLHVKPEHLDAFIAATIENARNSVQEAGIARFDFVQQVDDPTRFMLIEHYRTEEAIGAHKETAHFATWRNLVGEYMQGERTRAWYTPVYPAA